MGTFHPPFAAGAAALWEDGTVVLRAVRVDGDIDGLYMEGGPGGFTTILEEGQAAPGLAGRTLVTGPFGEWTSRQNGTFLQALTTNAAQDDRTAAWICSPACEVLLVIGDPFPGLAGVEWSFGVIAPRIGPPGEVAFYATLAGPGVTAGNGRAFVAGSSGNVTVVAREGDPAPGVSGNFSGSMFNTVQLAFNAAGQVGFLGSTDHFGVWSGLPASVALRALGGESAPADAGTWAQVRATSIQSDHQVMVYGDVAGRRVFTGVGAGSPRQAAVQGQQLDSGETLGSVLRPSVNGEGLIAFVSEDARVDGTNQSLVVADQLGTAGLLTAIARTGDDAPGMPDGVVFAAFIGEPVINNLQQVAFEALLGGDGVTNANRNSLWVHDPFQGLVAIARTGDPLRVAIGDTRILTSFLSSLASSQTADTRSLSDGRNLAFNDLGELVYQARFSNQTEAIVVGRVVPALFRNGFET